MSILLQKLTAAIADKSVPVPFPDWCKPNIEDVDELVTIRSRDESSGWAGYMHYTDARGKPSSRRIICRRIEGYGKAETIVAYCCERKMVRRFRVDQINELICLETGEFLEPIPHFEQMRMYGAMTMVDKSLNDFASALVFMAKCDGSVHPLEVESINDAIGTYLRRFGGDEKMFIQAQRNAGRIAPDGLDFVNAIERIERHADSQQMARLMLNALSSVVQADGILHANEVEWIGLVEEALQSMVAVEA